MSDTNRRIPFPFDAEVRAFWGTVSEHVRHLLNRRRAEIIPRENVQTFSHGVHWQAHSSDLPDNVSSMQVQEAGVELRTQEIIDGNLSIIVSTLNEFVEKMHELSMRSLYDLVSDTSDRVGNTVSAAQMAPADAFLEMLKKIEFGVDRNGDPVLPQVHAGSQAVEALIKDVESRGPGFKAEIERIQSEKMAQARQKEAERRAKFVRKQ